jgi:hypothetical protein
MDPRTVLGGCRNRIHPTVTIDQNAMSAKERPADSQLRVRYGPDQLPFSVSATPYGENGAKSQNLLADV